MHARRIYLPDDFRVACVFQAMRRDAAEQGVWDVLMDEDTFSEFADNAVGDASKAALQSQLADLFEDEGVPRDALLSTLHPWSAQLESLSLAAVTKELDR